MYTITDSKEKKKIFDFIIFYVYCFLIFFFYIIFLVFFLNLFYFFYIHVHVVGKLYICIFINECCLRLKISLFEHGWVVLLFFYEIQLQKVITVRQTKHLMKQMLSLKIFDFQIFKRLRSKTHQFQCLDFVNSLDE